MTPSTRTLYLQRTYSDEGDTDSNWPWKMIPQQAIPWCMTHDFVAQTEDNAGSGFTPGLCFSAHRDGTCTISTGGPDHKWWRDV